jgi:hypothetical protein
MSVIVRLAAAQPFEHVVDRLVTVGVADLLERRESGPLVQAIAARVALAGGRSGRYGE